MGVDARRIVNEKRVIMSKLLHDGGGERMNTWLLLLYKKDAQIYYVELVEALPEIVVTCLPCTEPNIDLNKKWQSSPHKNLQECIHTFWSTWRKETNADE